MSDELFFGLIGGLAVLGFILWRQEQKPRVVEYERGPLPGDYSARIKEGARWVPVGAPPPADFVAGCAEIGMKTEKAKGVVEANRKPGHDLWTCV